MSKAYFLPPDEAGRRTWLNNFSAKLIKYAGILGLNLPDVGQVSADTVFFNFVCDGHNQHRLKDEPVGQWNDMASLGMMG